MKKILLLSLLIVSLLSLGAAQEVNVETGYFVADSTGTKQVDVGFTPNYVEFTSNQKIESINTDMATTENSNCPENVNGWAEGTAVFESGSLQKQMSIGSFRNSDSTNRHRVGSSTNDVIRNIYTDRNGNECGKLEISMNQQTGSGFEVDVESKYNQYNEVVTYRAYRFPNDIEYDAGLEQITSTGQKDVTGLGFEPYYLSFRNGHLIDGYNLNKYLDGNYIGRSSGYATIDSGGNINQLSIGYGTNSHSTNAHKAYSSDTRVIRNIYSGQDGSNDGSTTASLQDSLSDGFRLNVGNNYKDEVFMYRAFESGTYNVEIGHKTISSTGNKVFDVGFTPDHFEMHSVQRVDQINDVYNSPVNSGCSNSYGWMDSWIDIGDSNQYSIGTGRSSDSMNADHVFASNSQLLKNVYTGQNSGECGRIEGQVTGPVSGQGIELDVSQTYVDEMMVYTAFDFTVVTSDPQFSGDRYVSDGTEKGNGATISTGSPTFGIDVNHPDGVEVTTEFISADSGNAFATDYVGGGSGEATATWSGLQSGKTYDWYVRACDNYGNCETSSTWSFTVNYDDQIGLRDDDYHPQGANTSVSDPFYTGYVDRIMDNSSQLEPGMKSSYFDMTASYSDPDKFHRDFGFISGASEAKWFDSQGTTDRSDRWSISDDVSESIGNTGQSYESGGTYYHPGYSGRIRTGPDDNTIAKPAKVFANSFAAVATEELENVNPNIRKGFGVWIDPDNIREFDEYYRGNWEDKILFEIDLTGPDAGIGFDSDRYGSLVLGNFEYRQISDTEVVGDIYWENEYQGQDQIPSELQQSMCGDDQTEYLIEEIGEINNSERFVGNYACTTTNDVCYDSQANQRRIFSTGTYRETDDYTEYQGRTKLDNEYCQEYSWDDGRFTGIAIQQDNFPGWYDQDFRTEYCKANTLFQEKGVRWIDNNYVDNNPHAVTGGIDDDWNTYVSEKIGSVSSVSPYTSQPENDNWVGMQSPVPTGTNGDEIATLGFCGGDDNAEYLVTQDCVTGACNSNNDVIGVASDPDTCVADGDTITSNMNDVQSVDYEDDSGNWQSMTGIESRRLVPEGRSIRLNYGGDARELTCFAGSFLEDWPVIFQEDSITVPYGETATSTFRLVNPDEQEVTYTVELDTTTASSVSGAGLESFTSIVDQDGQTQFNVDVPARSAETYQVQVRGGNDQIDDPSNNYVQIYAESNDGRITGSDSLGVEVVQTPATGGGAQGTSPNEVPGIMPVQVIMLVITAAASVFFLS